MNFCYKKLKNMEILCPWSFPKTNRNKKQTGIFKYTPSVDILDFQAK